MHESKGTLQHEIQQSHPFRSHSQEAVLGILRTADLLRRVISQIVEPWGITQQQYNVMRILRGAGDEGLPTLTIAQRMVERTPGITRLIDRLESKGWVERTRCPNDRRQVLCRISQSGLDLLGELDGPIDAFDDTGLAMLSASDQERMIELLDRVREGLRST